jgi:hypothetical protein
MKDLWHHLAPIAGTFHYFIAAIIGAGAVAIRKYMQRVRENKAAMWPSADGQVQTASVKKSQYGCWVDVTYRYYAQQEYRFGKYRRHIARRSGGFRRSRPWSKRSGAIPRHQSQRLDSSGAGSANDWGVAGGLKAARRRATESEFSDAEKSRQAS